MPPSAVRTLGDLLYWQYAKIISGSSGAGKRQYGFVMDRFTKLRSGEIAWDSIREWVKEHEDSGRCIFCGRSGPLTTEHLVPRSMGGPQDEKNVTRICSSCNSSKGRRGLYEYWTEKAGLKGAKYDVPRIAEGKYLKILHEILGPSGHLAWTEEELNERMCPSCKLHSLCAEQGSERKMSPLCLDGVVSVALRS